MPPDGQAQVTPPKRRRWLILLPPCLVYAVVVALLMSPGSPADLVPRLGLSFAVLQFVGLVLTLVAATNRRLAPRARRPWRLMTVGLVLLMGSGAAFAQVGRAGTDAFRAAPPLLIAAVGLRLAMSLMLLAALLSFAVEPMTRRGVLKVAFDVTTVVGGGAMAMWYLVIGPVIDDSKMSLTSLTLTSAVAVSDLVLVLGVCVALFRGVTPVARRPAGILVLGVLCYLGSDTFMSVGVAVQTVKNFPWWLCVFMVTPVFLMALAAAEQSRVAGAPVEFAAPRRFQGRTLTPYLGLAVGFGVLIIAAGRSGLFPWMGLVLCAGVMIFGVVARQIVALRENRDLAVTDSLTGLANRVRLKDGLDRAMQRSRRTGEPTAVLLIDMDDFKEVNDRLGHEAGDTLLIAFAAVLRDSVSTSDTVARLGGDEFAVLLNGVQDDARALAVADRILAASRSAEVSYQGTPLSIRVSIGVAVATFSGEGGLTSGAALLRQADIAMYAEKRRGTQGRQLYVPGMETADPAPAVLADLHHAVRYGQLRIEYQPIVELATGELTAVEALVRWQHPVLGLVPPATFIPLAEETGAIHDIGAWVLEEACRQVKQWQTQFDAPRPLQLSVNVSPVQLQRPALVGEIFEVLGRTGFDPQHLVVEVTESATVQQESAASVLRAVRARGVRIALDDFGTGYSSLRHLSKLPVDILKLDRCFVSELGTSPESAAVADVVIRLSRILHLDTVAEGIENPHQAAELSQLGYVHAQGYHFARPLPPEGIEELLQAAVLTVGR